DIYVQRLNELRLLATYLRPQPPERAAAFLKQYHETQAAGTHVAIAMPRLDVGKSIGVERSVIALVDLRRAVPGQAAAPAPPPAVAAPAVVAALKDRGKGRIENPLKEVVVATARVAVPNGGANGRPAAPADPGL